MWGMGVLLWEIWAQGQLPYSGMSNQVVIAQVLGGYRLARPDGNCPTGIYTVMRRCWSDDDSQRPNFTSLCASLRQQSGECIGALTKAFLVRRSDADGASGQGSFGTDHGTAPSGYQNTTDSDALVMCSNAVRLSVYSNDCFIGDATNSVSASASPHRPCEGRGKATLMDVGDDDGSQSAGLYRESPMKFRAGTQPSPGWDTEV